VANARLRYRERRRLIRKAVVGAFLLTFLVLLAYALFGERGILANLGVQGEYQRLLDERDRLVAENARLKKEIRELEGSSRKIEEIARRDYGLGRPGEIVFFFPDDPEEPVQMMTPSASGTAPEAPR